MTEQIENETSEEIVEQEPVVEELTGENSPVEEVPAVDESDVDEPTEEPETFPREYVEKLRAENAENRVKAKRSDDLAHRLHTALVEATGRLQDPRDLSFDDAHLDDPEALTTAVDNLLKDRPHLASRRVMGDIGQGSTGNPQNAVNLSAMLRGNL